MAIPPPTPAASEMATRPREVLNRLGTEQEGTMRNRLWMALSGLAAWVAVTTAIGLVGAGAASAGTHHAKPGATTTCGTNCADVYSELLGSGTIMNAYVPGDTGSGGMVGQKVNLKTASNTHPNEDFTDYALSNGTTETVADFCDAYPSPQSFNPTSYMCQNYSAFPVYELSWSPFGNESGLCAGVAKAGVNNENVTLRHCGTTDNTLWIVDENLCSGPYCPAVNGGDTAFSHPLVLTVNAGTTNPGNQLFVQRENLLNGGVVSDAQMYSFAVGPAA
jgi:hypothetical protein